MDTPRFRLSEIVAPTGASAATVRGWDFRFDLLAKPKGGEGIGGKRGSKGIASLLSLRSAYTVAIAVEIARHGVLPERAITLAKSFMHFSDDDERAPGELFPLPDVTVLAIFPGIDSPAVLKVPSKTFSVNLINLLSSWHGYGRQNSALVIFLNPIFQKMREGLQVD